jgi:membrane-associated phospholipid phosphatase
MQATIPLTTARGTSIRRALVRIVSPVLIWGVYAALLVPYVLIRGVCDELFAPKNIEPFESALFFGHRPTDLLQDGLSGEAFWTVGFLTHLSWFFLPLAWGLVVVALNRERLVEYFFWLLLASYLSTISFLLVPIEPPWMQPGVGRILVEHGLFDYAGVDDNPVASLPSLHASLPMVMAFFFLLRMRRPRLAAVIAGHGFLIGMGVVYLGEHWMLDVVAGWFLAAAVAWLCTSAMVRRLADQFPGRPVERIQLAGAWLMTRGAEPAPIIEFESRREESVA